MKLFRPATYYETDFGKQLAATIIWAQIFAIYTLIMVINIQPTASQIFWADPFLKVLPIQISVWLVIIVSLIIAIWCFQWLGSFSEVIKNTPVWQIISGISAAVIIGLLIRWLVGDTLPDFVPAEESAKPGFLFGMAAGYGEEVLVRFLIAPLTMLAGLKYLKYESLSKRVLVSATLAIALTAIAFVGLHELGESDGVVVMKLVATRFIVPCFLMGSLYFLIGPGFVIFMHATMHIIIPLLFS